MRGLNGRTWGSLQGQAAFGLRRQQPSIWLRTALWPAPAIYTATLVAAAVGLRGRGPLFVAYLATRGFLVAASVAAVAAFEASRCVPANLCMAFLPCFPCI